MIRFLFCLLSILFVNVLVAQVSPRYAVYVSKADSLYRVKKYKESAELYSEAFRSNNWKAYENDRYNAACCWALCENSDSAFYQLNYVATVSEYGNYRHITTDADLNSLHADKRWPSLLELVKKNKEKAEANLDKVLTPLLDSIYGEDQDYRRQLGDVEAKYGRDSKEMRAHWDKINHSDSLNLIVVRKILDERGWLGADEVGDNGNSTLFLVIQHSDQQTQEKYLPMMREAVKNGKAKGSSLALLEDRVALGQGKKQVYGSQIGRKADGTYYVQSLEDPENVDKRRVSVGLGPLNEYTAHWNFKWDVEQHKKDIAETHQK